ncbi:unnamed protein product, partial [Ceratitis capitata]
MSARGFRNVDGKGKKDLWTTTVKNKNRKCIICGIPGKAARMAYCRPPIIAPV